MIENIDELTQAEEMAYVKSVRLGGPLVYSSSCFSIMKS